jgi:hypothetical protein
MKLTIHTHLVPRVQIPGAIPSIPMHFTLRSVIKPLKTNRKLFYLKTQFVLHSKHFSSLVIEANQRMLYKAKFAVCSEINTKHVNTMRGKNVQI